MMRMTLVVMAAVIVLLIRSTMAAASDSVADTCTPAILDRGKLMFNQCATCHSFKVGDPAKVGPNLFGVKGRKAGSVTDFTFSRAMRESDIFWTNEALDRFLANPQSFVSGTQMGYAGVKQPQDRAAVICYLGSSIMSVRQ